jgi:hypothetical protein
LTGRKLWLLRWLEAHDLSSRLCKTAHSLTSFRLGRSGALLGKDAKGSAHLRLLRLVKDDL